MKSISSKTRLSGFPRIIFMALLMIAFLAQGAAFAKTISGTVFDHEGEPAIGATVMVKGTQVGTSTDISGNFTIANVAGDAGRLPEWRTNAENGQQRQTAKEGSLTATKGQWVPNSLILYQNGQFVGNSCSALTTERNNFFCGINKTDDGTREAEKGDAHRDVTMARVGETYLMRAELYVRQGEYDKAMDDINFIRKRAAWHDGENRSYYTDGSMAYPTNTKVSASNTTMYENSNLWMNTYYLSNPDVEVSTASTEAAMTNWTWDNLPAEDEAILAKIGATSKYDRALNFILNERTRELIGEWQRWEALSRTGTLIKRAKAFNSQAAPNIKDYHALRPMAQSFIDGLQHADGSNLSAEEAKEWQNPGY